MSMFDKFKEIIGGSDYDEDFDDIDEVEEEEEEVLIPDMSDPNKMMTPDEIAALIANL